MSLRDLIQHFDSERNLPLKPTFVRDKCLEFKTVDEIVFHKFPFDTGKLRGLYILERYEHPTFGPFKRANVFFPGDAPEDERRFVCVKELMHVFDPEKDWIASTDEIRELVARLGMSMDVLHAVANRSDVDRRAILPALAILAPKRIRPLLRKKHNEGKIEIAEIAELIGVPERYIRFVLGELFDESLASVLGKETLAIRREAGR